MLYVAIGFGLLVFLSAVVIVMALMLRNQWNEPHRPH